MYQIPVPVDVGSILIFILSSLLGIVYFSLRNQFFMLLEKVETKCSANDEAIKDRLSRLEDEIGNMPAKLEQVLQKINQLELMLANHYATKGEVRDALTTREELLELVRGKKR